MAGGIAQDHSGAEKADARQDSLHDAPDRVLLSR